VRCTTPAKLNSAPPQLGGGAAGGSGAAVWAVAGSVADRSLGRIVGSSGRRCGPLRGNSRQHCGPPRGQHRAELRAASSTATAAAAVAAVSNVGIVSRELGCV
jgi:hypothetical protein